MVKLSDMKGQEVLDVQEGNGEIKFILKNGRKYLLKVQDDKFVFDSID